MVAHILSCIRRFEAIEDWKAEAKRERETELAGWLDINNNNNRNESGI